MPRILVADDNSNIQKMVALAFKDQGVEVIGVGNGEAAVRKVPEINPDVILADVFMPVRSGYEVCEFVKNDSRYMHTPVVLLVGAFDPLDEHEAQRVRADGVLKKPFVPPEPLINLVKALLVKSASERLVAVAVPAASASVKAEVGHEAPAQEKHVHDFGDEATEEFATPTPISPIANSKPGGYDSPVAFGALLEAPTVEIPALDEIDPIITSSRDPSLGEPAFWSRATQAAAEEEEVEAPVEEDEATEHSWGHHESLPGLDDTAEIEQPIELDHEAARTRSLEIAQEEAESVITAPPIEALEVISETELSQETTKQETVTRETEEQETSEEHGLALETRAASDFDNFDLAPTPMVIEWPHPEDSLPGVMPAASVEPVVPVEPAPVAAGPDPALEPPIGSEAPAVSTSVDPILESTAEQAADLQANWHPVFEAVAEETPETESRVLEDLHEAREEQEVATSWPPAFHPVTASAEPAKAAWPPTKLPEVQAFPKEPAPVATVVSAVAPRAPEVSGGLPRAAEAIANAAADLTKSTVKEASESGALSPEMVEAVVNRIVDRMQPKILEMVTREILRPVVEALVRREIGKK